MIVYEDKDLTTVEAGIVAHGCNCQGKMGSGVALAIRNKWPKVYKAYQAYWDKHKKNREDLLGFVLYVNTNEGLNLFGLELYVANIFTQVFYGRDGKRYADPEAINQGVSTVVSFAEERKLDVYMPRIGCNLGGLNWEVDVQPIVEKIAEAFPDVTIHICNYAG